MTTEANTNRPADSESDATPTLVATFEQPRAAGSAVRALRDLNVPSADIGIVLADTGEARALLESGPAKPEESAALGSAVGATLFGLAAFALAGPIGVLTVGPFAAILGGAAAGAGAGGLLGGLVGLGIPEQEAAMRVEQIQHGGCLLSCRVPDGVDASSVQAALEEHGARETFTLP